MVGLSSSIWFWLIDPIQLFYSWSTIPKKSNGFQYDYKGDEYYGWITMNQYRKLTKFTPQNRSVDSTAFLF